MIIKYLLYRMFIIAQFIMLHIYYDNTQERQYTRYMSKENVT